jgi:anti-sigma factor RsiW
MQRAVARLPWRLPVLPAAAAVAVAVLSLTGSVQLLRAALSRHAAVLFSHPHQLSAEVHLMEITVENRCIDRLMNS